jgi:hypothetical protein
MLDDAGEHEAVTAKIEDAKTCHRSDRRAL